MDTGSDRSKVNSKRLRNTATVEYSDGVPNQTGSAGGRQPYAGTGIAMSEIDATATNERDWKYP